MNHIIVPFLLSNFIPIVSAGGHCSSCELTEMSYLILQLNTSADLKWQALRRYQIKIHLNCKKKLVLSPQWTFILMLWFSRFNTHTINIQASYLSVFMWVCCQKQWQQQKSNMNKVHCEQWLPLSAACIIQLCLKLLAVEWSVICTQLLNQLP